MTTANIIIKAKSDTTPALPELNGQKVEMTMIKDFVILEKGMQSGGTSVSIHMVLDDGRHVIAETSSKVMQFFCGALIGAEERFAAERTKQN